MIQPIRQTRLPKFRRAGNPPKIQNLEQYSEILLLVQQHRFIEGRAIAALVNTHPVTTRRRLQRLYHNGYLERYVIPTTNNTPGSTHMIYTLCRKGANVLLDLNPQLYGKVYFPRQRRSTYHVAHTLMVSNFITILTKAVEMREGVYLKEWRVEKQAALRFPFMKSFGLVPDAYVSLQVHGTEHHFYLEADRGTMPLMRFAEKIKKYRKFFMRHRKSLPSRFQVLTIAPTETRAQNLCALTIHADPQKQGSTRFLSTATTRYDLSQVTTILDPIWHVGHYLAQVPRALIPGKKW